MSSERDRGTGRSLTSEQSAEAPDASPEPAVRSTPPPPARKSIVAKVSHTLRTELALRLERFAFFQRVSESSVIEHSLERFFEQSDDDEVLGELLRKGGAGRRRKAVD